MKQVWQCDFCSITSKDETIILMHESDCVFNPINHSCYTCLYAVEDNYMAGCYGCEKDLDFLHYEGNGDCEKWDHKNIFELRKLKIKNLIK